MVVVAKPVAVEPVAYALRLPQEIHAALLRLALVDERSVNYEIVRACRLYVTRRRVEASYEPGSPVVAG